MASITRYSSKTLSTFSRNWTQKSFLQQNAVQIQFRKYSTEQPQSKLPVELIKQLRQRTLAGYTDCKNALVAENNDIEKAIEWLKKKGAIKAAGKSNRVAAEGVVGMSVNAEHSVGAITELNSETDFVSRGELFSALARNITSAAIRNIKPTTSGVEPIENSLKESSITQNGTTVPVTTAITEVIAKLGENIQLRRAAQLSVPSGKGVVCGYVHRVQGQPADGVTLGSIAGLVALECEGVRGNPEKEAKLIDLGNKLAMHVVGYNPRFVSRDKVTKQFLEQAEIDFKREQEDKMADKNKKFNLERIYADVVLLEQHCAFFSDKRVDLVLKDFEKQLGSPVKITSFVKYTTGEGIEKKADDFAQEVQKMVS